MKTKNVTKIIGVIIAIIFFCGCSGLSKIALEKFISGKQKVLVCPVHILSNQESTYDTIMAKKIAAYINDKKYADASVTQLCPPPNNEWRADEAKMLTISIDLFIEYVKTINLPDDTYILYAEFFKSGQNTKVRAVHYCLLNNKGEIAMRGLINSHWDEFKKVNPKTDDDCVAVFINGFEEKMKK
ncbi:MAG: hypothetical protein H8E34_04210 [Bacteroidetes bacterium]|nr:hypothetical protein [Bacteroidota bacterium]MBL6943239.1 hypothetical protein [Bacteroidales bacterium]